MWKRDFPSIYGALKEEWSPLIKPIITALQGKILVQYNCPKRDLYLQGKYTVETLLSSHLLSSHPLLSIDKQPVIKGAK